MHVILEVTKGTEAGERLMIDRPKSVIVGRKDDRRVVFQISDRRFSRYHFVLEVRRGECSIRDLGSTNGTYVNGKKIKQSRIKDGDVIHIGKDRFLEFLVKIDDLQAVLPDSACMAALSAEKFSPEPAPQAPATPEVMPVAPTSAEGFAGISVAAAGGGKKSKLDMDTLPIDAPSVPISAGRLFCACCGAVADETELADLVDTRMLTYACRKCHDERTDEDHPIPNYEVLDIAGRGSLGVVYRARRLSTGKLAALKLVPRHLSENPQVVQLFLRQMRLTAKLQHANIVPVIEMGKAGGQLWLATEFIEGMDSAELARQSNGRLALPDAISIICQILSALDYAHGLNLVHRDVKPPNVLVSGQPGDYLARLSDFGLIKNMDEAGLSGITAEGVRRGTVPFMSPEQALDSRSIKPASDIYSAGATVYWLLTGEFPFDFEALDKRGEIRDPFLIILEDRFIPLCRRDPSIPKATAEVIEQALQRDPEDRFETAAAMAEALLKTFK